jgi:hypothetical protein
MKIWIHSAVLATCLGATAAVALASAAVYNGDTQVGAKSDRLPLVADAGTSYLTIETRKDGVSVLSRVPVNSN